MKEMILLELADRWESDAIAPEIEDGSPEARRGNDISKGRREGLRECTDALRMLVSLLGDGRVPRHFAAQAIKGPLRP